MRLQSARKDRWLALAAVAAGLLMVVDATFGSKPTWPKRTPEERRAIEALRYHDGIGEDVAHQRFLENLKRDCGGWGYAYGDADLTVEAVARTYSTTMAAQWLARDAPALCPTGVAKMTQWLQHENVEVARQIARKYLAEHQEPGPNQYWPFLYSEVDDLVDLVASGGTQVDLKAFRTFWCRYHQRDRYYHRGPADVLERFRVAWQGPQPIGEIECAE